MKRLKMDYKKMSLKINNKDKNIIMNKDEFRKKSIFALKKISKYKRYVNSKVISKSLKQIIKKLDATNILLYIPLNMEVDTTTLIKELRPKLRLFVPFMEIDSFKVVKYRLPLSRKKFNIMEPNNSYAKAPKIDVAVVPVVGVDGMMGRIGFGKGMYDRFFATLKHKPIIIFVQLIKNFTTEQLCEAHDIKADIYITPNETIIKRGIDVFRNRIGARSSRSNRCDRFFYS